MLYDLIFMDLSMPVMDGLDSIKLIRKIDKKNLIKIIVVTAYTDKQERPICADVGADAFIEKPLTVEKLA